MKSTRILFVSGIIFSILLLSCQDPVVPTQNAVKMTKEELKNTTGYEWFNAYWTLYKPDSATAQEINLNFNTDDYKFVLFIEPSCTCRDIIREPADMVKVLDIANISSQYYEIYSMGSVASKHPFENKLTIKALPQIYLVKSGEFVYSILDTFNYYFTRDNSTKIESIVLEAIQNN